ncbi:MerR family transcriptional regulator [Paenarthrobacter sp. Z7-10]|uniref:MerR family transcriptional regulator n=1 Tax=Paenarthrobacter sp. Z7-10 TaxID=2787635 RepID=UPI0022A920FD|nr:MerR family transcriptional regulator [Paenarthrobacter sp. Z7-10]MCZ2403693.1 MerR family transcriptional regulator [Paenarthrobacter sp. Z7-10]
MIQVPDPRRGVYAISVAAELVGTGQQNLRLYERKGLVEPSRTSGGTRKYSDEDLVTLRRVDRLLGEGLNLAGIRMVLRLEAINEKLSKELGELREPGEVKTAKERQRKSR